MIGMPRSFSGLADGRSVDLDVTDHLLLALPAPVIDRLQVEAGRRGVEPGSLLVQLLGQELPTALADAARDLLRQPAAMADTPEMDNTPGPKPEGANDSDRATSTPEVSLPAAPAPSVPESGCGTP